MPYLIVFCKFRICYQSYSRRSKSIVVQDAIVEDDEELTPYE